MKKFVSLLALAVSVSAMANVKIEKEFYVFNTDENIVNMIKNNTELIIDHVGAHGFEVYGPKGTEKYLSDLGLEYMDAQKNLKNKNMDAGYPTPAQIEQKLRDAVALNPKIAKVFSIGKSIQGRDLLVVKISDNVNVDENEPEFKYISSMHGDEITGRELMTFYVKDLIEGYGKDAEITKLINNTEIYIMASMNPDGSNMMRRYNANYVDLNRNFPEITRNDDNTSEGREPETKAIMKFQAERNFALSANFHGGAVCVNYPWDAKKERHPFDAMLQELSLAYANLNPEMRNSRDFNRGITNGADWYVLKGGMQDWSYIWHNDLQVTIELSDQKWPSYSKIPGYYRNNKDSIQKYLTLVHQGAGIAFADKAVTGTVAIKSSNKDYGIFGFNHGEFYKVLPEGEYTFTVKANGETREVSLNVTNDVAEPNIVQL